MAPACGPARRTVAQVSLARMATQLLEAHPDVLAAISTAEQQLARDLAAEEARAAEHHLHAVRATIVESGVLLYFHTAAGAWSGAWSSAEWSGPERCSKGVAVATLALLPRSP